MDHRWAIRSVHDDQLQDVSGAIGSQNQVSGRIVGDFLDDRGVSECMKDLRFFDPMPKGGEQDIHEESYYETALAVSAGRGACASASWPMSRRPITEAASRSAASMKWA